MFKITDPAEAALIAGGSSVTPDGVFQGETGWCTVDEETAAAYLKEGPLWVIKVNGKNYCQIHVESNQMMDANDEDIRVGFGVHGVSARLSVIEDPIVIAAVRGAHIPVKDSIDDGTPGTPLTVAKEIMNSVQGPKSIRDVGKTTYPKVTPEQLQVLMTAPKICATVWIACGGGEGWPPMLAFFLTHLDECREALQHYLPIGRLPQEDADFLIAHGDLALTFTYTLSQRIGGMGAKVYAENRNRQEGTPEDAQLVAVQRAMLQANPVKFIGYAKRFFDCWWNPLAPEFMKAASETGAKLDVYQILGWLRWLGHHPEVAASFPPGGLTDTQQEMLLSGGGFNITEDAVKYWARAGMQIPPTFLRGLQNGRGEMPVDKALQFWDRVAAEYAPEATR